MARGETDFERFVRDLFAPLGPIAIRRMFGGAGVYAAGVMIALLADETIYLKADAASAPAFDAEGCAPFVYAPPSGKAVAMSYRRMPDHALDEPEEAARWGRMALEAARRAAAAKPQRRPQR